MQRAILLLCVVGFATVVLALEGSSGTEDANEISEEEAQCGRAERAASGRRGLLGTHDALLAALAGARGLNRLVVCAGGERAPAVLWRGRWALARASDLRAPLHHMRVLQTDNHLRTCAALDKEPFIMGLRSRRVVRRMVLAGGRRGAGAGEEAQDVALLQLDLPFLADEPLGNETLAQLHLASVKNKMEHLYNEYWRRQEDSDNEVRYVAEIRFLLAVIVPGALLIVVFLFVIFNTGTPIKVPYSNVKDPLHTPWKMHEYNSSVKCYPAYGKVTK